MRFTLNTWQRMMCVQALNAQAGHISLLRKALKLLEVLELSEEERALVGLVQDGDNVLWMDRMRRFDLEVTDRELAAFLKRAVAGYQGWLVGQHEQVFELFAALGIEEEPAA